MESTNQTGTTMNTSNGPNTVEMGGVCTIYNTRPISTDEEAELFFHTTISNIVYMILLPIVVALGLAGNFAFLFMVARLRRMKTAVNFFLVNLAINDIVFLTTQSMFLMYVFFLSPVSYRYPFKTTGSCIIIYLIGYLSHYCSTSIITLVSIERFYAICHPLKHRMMQGSGHTLIAMTMAYVVSIVLAVVTLMKRMRINEVCLKWPDDKRYENVPVVYRQCGPLLGIEEIVVSTEIMYWVLFFIAAVINGALYARIIIALGSRSVSGSASTDNQNTSVRNQVARALVINGILFFVTQIPMRLNDINEILVALDEPQILSQHQKSDFLSISALFLFINSALNPYVYAFSSSNYRQGFKDAFSFKVKHLAQNGKTPLHSKASNATSITSVGTSRV